MADEKRGMFVVQRDLVVGWLVGKVDEIHDRYEKNNCIIYMMAFFHQRSTHLKIHSRFRLHDKDGKNKMTEKWMEAQGRMGELGNQYNSAKQWQQHWGVYKKQFNNKHD